MKISTTYESPQEWDESSSIIFVGRDLSIEERTEWWRDKESSNICIVEEIFPHIISDDDLKVDMSSTKEVQNFIRSAIKSEESKIVIDLTSLSYSVWASILRAANEMSLIVDVCYVEPEDYAAPERNIAETPYNLSERVEGLRPIPGFSRLSGEFETEYIFIAFLGFEGFRFGYIVHSLDVEDDRIYPVIGVPGFRPEFVDSAYDGNKHQLKDFDCIQNIRYCSACCPFSAYDLLAKITKEYDTKLYKIAPLGTKPQALGCLLFCMKNDIQVEIVYDHPVRKKGRSKGIGKFHVYNVSFFLK